MTDLASAPPRVFVPHRGRGIALVLLSSLCFGSSGAVGKPAMTAGMAPEQVTAVRLLLAAVLLVVGVAVFRPSLLRVGRGDVRVLAGYGLLGVAGVQLLYFVSASRIPVGIAILLEFTSPVLIALWVRFVRRVRMPPPVWAGIALAMVGLALVAQVWQGLRLDALGVLAGLGAAVCSASYFLIGEHAVATRPPLGMITWGMAIGAVSLAVVVPPWTLPMDVLAGSAEFGPWQPPVWLLMVVLSVVCTVMAYLSGISALRHVPATAASVLAMVEPVIATTAAWVLLGEALTAVQIAGAGVLLTGALIVQLTSPGKQQAGTPAEPLPSGPDVDQAPPER
ncbi:EamA family transporter [Amycolatopsis antarctica]|uniref:EamA family transporter n=1 Tax=Amycolatopsis antarctica TaxID=1854586 RepID=A0A263D8S5_9PSEU|nr:EamA family transporter [Amycolatopsis antarctica]OZM74408.1 EamA family transporter [Amycolatopsis antarctica]